MSKTHEKWNRKAVADRLEEAASTLKRLPREGIQGYANAWPDVVYNAWELMRQEKGTLKLGPPPADQISRMEETIDWLFWLEDEERKLVWLRAEKVRWKVIAWKWGLDRGTVWRRWLMAVTKISVRLNTRKTGGNNVATK